jgi:MraZ protein
LRKPFFFGEHELTIDSKNRMLIPSQIRKSLDPESDGTSFFVIVRAKVAWFYPCEYFKKLTDLQVSVNLLPDEPEQMFTHFMLSKAAELEWDNQGRVLLTPMIMTDTEMGNDRDVMLVGARDHLELWRRDKWKERSQLVSAQSGQIIEWWHKAQQPAKPEAPKEPVKDKE